MPRTRNSGSNPRDARIDLPALLFDLDGTLIDSNYHHVATWSEALRSAGIIIPNWKIHRRIGMSGRSFLRELLREIPHRKEKVDLDQLERKHDALFRRTIARLVPLPGANELLRHLADSRLRIAIATTGGKSQTSALLCHLDIPNGTQVVTGDDVQQAKPAPDIFVLAAQRLNIALSDCNVVGDSAWDMLAAVRKSALGVGLLSGAMERKISNVPVHSASIPTPPICSCTSSNWVFPEPEVPLQSLDEPPIADLSSRQRIGNKIDQGLHLRV